jgi:uncharacterized SAM-binding protein YcdF (DUF218 family)
MIIVLGSPNDPSGRLSPMALERLRQARREHERHPDYPILLTGGFGAHFNQSSAPHAEHARAFLVSAGVRPDSFVEFTLSSNTIEDATFSRPIVERIDPACLVVITSDLHLPRARHIFDRVFGTLPVRYVGVPHDCSEEERRRLTRHESAALARLRKSNTSSWNRPSWQSTS